MSASQPVRLLSYNPTTKRYEEITAGKGMPVMDTWRIDNVQAVGTNTVTVEVPATQEWQLLWLHVDYSSDATVGARRLAVEFLLGGNQIGLMVCGVTQAASLTYDYEFAPGLPDFTTVRDTTFVSTPLPANILLRPAMQIHVFDGENVSGGDVLNLRYQYAYRTISQGY